MILGALCIAGTLIFGFPYATSIGIFVGVTSLIPILGAYLGAAVGVLLIFQADPAKALLFVVFIIVLQQLEGNLIYPRVMGTSLGLPGLWVFAAVVIGGGLGGIVESVWVQPRNDYKSSQQQPMKNKGAGSATELVPSNQEPDHKVRWDAERWMLCKACVTMP